MEIVEEMRAREDPALNIGVYTSLIKVLLDADEVVRAADVRVDILYFVYV